MKFVSEVLMPVLTFLTGGGIMYIVLFRQRMRRESNKINQEEFVSLSQVVETSMRQLKELSERLIQMEEVRYQLSVQVNEAKQVIADLRKENETLRKLIEQHGKQYDHTKTKSAGTTLENAGIAGKSGNAKRRPGKPRKPTTDEA